jgi:hypothetical protein
VRERVDHVLEDRLDAQLEVLFGRLQPVGVPVAALAEDKYMLGIERDAETFAQAGLAIQLGRALRC